MSRFDKIAYLGDVQLGRKLGSYDPTNDLMTALWSFAEQVVEENCTSVVQLGDLIDTNKPSSRIYGLVIEWLMYLTNNGVHVYVVAGNHEATHTRKDMRTCLDFLVHVNPWKIHIINRTGLMSNPDPRNHLYFAVPYPSRHSYHRDWQAELLQRFRCVVKHAVRQDKQITVWSHVDIEGLAMGKENTMRGSARCLPTEIIQSPRVDVIYAGHIHLSQTATGRGADIQVLGCVSPLRFDEIHSHRWFIVTKGNDRLREIIIPHRKFYLIEPDCRGLGDDWFRETKTHIAIDNLEDAVLKVIPTVREEDKIDWKVFEQYVRTETDIEYLYPVVPKVELVRTVRDKKQTFKLPWKKALRRTLLQMGSKKKERIGLLRMASEAMDFADGGSDANS